MRTNLIAGNWKMYKTGAEARLYIQELDRLIVNQAADVAVLAPFTCLWALAESACGAIQFGAQNLFWEAEGAYTGEISPRMLNEFNCAFVLVGHSERRQLMGENDVMINRKLKAAIDHGLTPILCVGETLSERQAGNAQAVVASQLIADLAEVPVRPELVIAYEPVWAIGTGVNATPEDAQEMCGHIRHWLADAYGDELADQIRILYGGSVKPDNIKDIMAESDIDGALVGGASLEPETFAKIINFR